MLISPSQISLQVGILTKVRFKNISEIIRDLLNLFGCWFEPATLPTQFYTAMLYTVTTMALLSQALYYNYVYKREGAKITSFLSWFGTKREAFHFKETNGFNQSPMQQSERSGMIGTSMGWMMAAIYMGGRLPQIFLNIKRHTAEGLNPLMFMFAIVGNATYVGSILIRSTEWAKLIPNMPWLVDAGVCVLLDCFIISQFIYFRSRKTTDNEDADKSYEACEPVKVF